MQNAIPESDFNRKEYEDSGDAPGAGTKDIAGEMDYVFNMRIKITDPIPFRIQKIIF